MATVNGDFVGHQNDAFVAEENWNRKEEKPRYSVASINVPAGVRRKPRPSCFLIARKTRKTTQFLAAAAANMGAFALGSVLSWTATALPSMEDLRDFHIDSDDQSWIAAMATLGAVAACPFGSSGMSYFGRRKTMLIMTLPFIIGWMLIYFAQNLAMIYIGRFLTGLAGGSFTITAPVFIAETADIKYRGGLASAFDLMVSTGMFFILVIGDFLPWRAQAMACGIIPLILFALVSYVPESPRYLVEQEEYTKATEALAWLYGLPPDEVRLDLQDLILSVNENKEKPVTFRKIFMKMSVLKPILVCLGLMLFTTMSGYDAVMSYTVEIFESAGTSLDPNYSAIVLGGIQVVATIPAAFIVDKSGRRSLLMISEVFMCLSLLAMGAYFFLQRPHICEACKSLSLGWLPLTSLTSFIIAYSVGIGPLSLMMIGELLPQHIKGLASCIVLTTRWILGFGVTKTFEDFGDELGKDGCYWLFSICCALGCLFVYFGIPETKGQTLDEIQLFFVSAAKLKLEQQQEEQETEETTEENSNGDRNVSAKV